MPFLLWIESPYINLRLPKCHISLKACMNCYIFCGIFGIPLPERAFSSSALLSYSFCAVWAAPHAVPRDTSNKMSAIRMSGVLQNFGIISFFNIQRIWLKPHPLEWQNLTLFLAYLGSYSSVTFRGRKRFQISVLSQFTCSPVLTHPGLDSCF